MINDSDVISSNFDRTGVKNRFSFRENENSTLDMLDNNVVVISRYGLIVYCGLIDSKEDLDKLIINLKLANAQ